MRPTDGESATFRIECAGEDGLIVALLPGCFDEEGAALSGGLEADGLEEQE